MFKNALVYRIDQWQQQPLADIEERLAGARFIECGATQMESAGWVEPRGQQHGALIESVGGQLVLKLCVERKAVPGSVVKGQLEERLAKIDRDTGRRPKGKQAKEIKEEIVHELLPRAFPRRSTTLVWIDPEAGRILVDSGSAKKAERVMTLLVEALGGGIVLRELQTELSPATAMAQWLQEQEAPAGFGIDRECVLQQPDSEKSVVRYARHTLELDEIREHIQQGKYPTQLAMTWDGRVSFVLTDTLTLRKLTLLDGVLEGADAKASPQDDGFDADVAITTGELRRMIPDLIDALGGLAASAPVTATGDPASAAQDRLAA